MPAERFFNLPEEKKDRIIKAALKEYGRVPYEEISINRIIQDAGIPRGSFYQYFEDKQDLQNFLLDGFKEKMYEKVHTYLNEKMGDLFQFFADALKEIADVGMKGEFKAVCKNTFSQLKYCDSGQKEGFFSKDLELLFFEIMKQMKDEYYQDYSMEELTLVWEILLQLIKDAIVKIFLFEEEKNVVMDKYQKKIRIVEAGMKAKERENA